jgi:hypothetical protein
LLAAGKSIQAAAGGKLAKTFQAGPHGKQAQQGQVLRVVV